MQLFIQQLFSNPENFFWTVLVVVFSICVHEFCHAWVALAQGDSTAADNGHLTLNPLKQMGWTSLFTMLFVGLAWGQVPVNPQRMKHRWSHALVAFSGPAANLVLWLGFLIVGVVTLKMGYGDTRACAWVLNAAVLNIVLFLLNMLPVPGFDGWVVLSAFFPGLQRNGSELVKGAFFVAVMLIFIGVKYLFWIGSVATGVVGQLMAYGSLS